MRRLLLLLLLLLAGCHEIKDLSPADAAPDSAVGFTPDAAPITADAGI